jgi:hypothetical protein
VRSDLETQRENGRKSKEVKEAERRKEKRRVIVTGGVGSLNAIENKF